jgi:hypothetical protein
METDVCGILIGTAGGQSRVMLTGFDQTTERAIPAVCLLRAIIR